VKTLFFLLISLPSLLFARTIIVDSHGSGQFTTIIQAISAAANNDTIKVWPGEYDGAFTIDKSVILMGSGYENTIIRSNSDPTIAMKSGKIMWFAITSNKGVGIDMSSGHVTNCIIRGCARDGIWTNANSTVIISNCVVYGNGGSGIFGYSASVFNCISYANTDYGYRNYSNPSLIVNYSCGNSYYVAGNSGNINTNPFFTSSTDYHISPTSPCWNAGKPDVLDPDGSRSDMGYFGGPDCPIFPIVTEISLTPTGTTVQIKATARANY